MFMSSFMSSLMLTPATILPIYIYQGRIDQDLEKMSSRDINERRRGEMDKFLTTTNTKAAVFRDIIIESGTSASTLGSVRSILVAPVILGGNPLPPQMADSTNIYGKVRAEPQTAADMAKRAKKIQVTDTYGVRWTRNVLMLIGYGTYTASLSDRSAHLGSLLLVLRRQALLPFLLPSHARMVPAKQCWWLFTH